MIQYMRHRLINHLHRIIVDTAMHTVRTDINATETIDRKSLCWLVLPICRKSHFSALHLSILYSFVHFNFIYASHFNRHP